MSDSQANAESKNGACLAGKVKRWWLAYQWYVVVSAGGAALILGCLGHWWHFLALGLHPSFFDVFHPTLQLFLLNFSAGLHPNWALEIARFLAPFALGYTATQAFLGALQQRYRLARLYFQENHVVVCGLGRKGMQLVRDFRAAGKTVVVIDCDEHNDLLRHCRDLGATVLLGDATEDELLRQARVGAASCVVATTGDDGVNVEIAVHAYDLSRDRTAGKLQCLVHVVDPTLCAVFKQAPLFRTETERFEVKVFNIYENCARQLFEEEPLDRTGIHADSSVSVHLVIIGFGQMGQSVALQAARIGHFANGRRLRVSVVDKRADEVRQTFLALYPQYGQVCDVEFVSALAGSADVNEKLVAWAAAPDTWLTVAVCLDNDSRSLTRALAVAEKLRNHDAHVLVRMEEDTGLASLLACDGTCHPVVQRVRAFGQINRASALARLLSEEQDKIARRLHENYLGVARQDTSKRSDDPVLRDWSRLPESYRDANRHVADHVPVKLRAVGLPDKEPPAREFTAEEIEVLSQMEHARWLAERLLAGWRYAPPPKNDQLKTNPNIIPWDQLDEVNKEKDRKAVREMRRWLLPPAAKT